MKPSVFIFSDIPRELNRLAVLGSEDCATLRQLIAYLDEGFRAQEYFRARVRSIAGLKTEWREMPLTASVYQDIPTDSPTRRNLRGPAFPLAVSTHRDLTDVIQDVARAFARLGRTPAPRNPEEWEKTVLPPAATLAQRVIMLYDAGHGGRLRKCEECSKWFLGRLGARVCTPNCRKLLWQRGHRYKITRRIWELENRLIPGVKKRLRKLSGPQNQLRYEHWERKKLQYEAQLQAKRKGLERFTKPSEGR